VGVVDEVQDIKNKTRNTVSSRKDWGLWSKRSDVIEK
jgi:hypothetical protein